MGIIKKYGSLSENQKIVRRKNKGQKEKYLEQWRAWTAAVIQTKKEKHQMENGKDSFHYLWHPPENNLLRLGKL